VGLFQAELHLAHSASEFVLGVSQAGVAPSNLQSAEQLLHVEVA
jgi:hypothetical protein